MRTSCFTRSRIFVCIKPIYRMFDGNVLRVGEKNFLYCFTMFFDWLSIQFYKENFTLTLETRRVIIFKVEPSHAWKSANSDFCSNFLCFPLLSSIKKFSFISHIDKILQALQMVEIQQLDESLRLTGCIQNWRHSLLTQIFWFCKSNNQNYNFRFWPNWWMPPLQTIT